MTDKQLQQKREKIAKMIAKGEQAHALDTERISASDLGAYAQLPLALLSLPISNDARVVYSTALMLARVSAHEGWVDEAGDCYVRMPQSMVQNICGCTRPTASKIMRELVTAGLIEYPPQEGIHECRKLYPKKIKQPKSYTFRDLFDTLNGTDHRAELQAWLDELLTEPTEQTEAEKKEMEKRAREEEL